MATLVALAALVCWGAFSDFRSSPRLFREAKEALAQGELARAEKLALLLARRSGQGASGNLLAAEAAIKLGRPHDAVAYYEKIPDDGSPTAIQAMLTQGDLLLNTLFQLTDAERAYRRILQREPHELAAHYRIAYVLGLQGRSWEAAPHRLELIRGDRREPIQLVLLALSDTAEENSHLIDDYVQASPEDPGALTARAWLHLRHEEFDSARRLLEKVTSTEPHSMTSQAWLGRTLLDRPAEDFLQWHQRLPPDADLHPDIWYTRGRWALANSQPRVAARCFWESVRLDPEYLAANFHLGAVLASLGEVQASEMFRRRARLLGDYTIAAKSYQSKNTPANAKTAAQLAEELGLLWEAWGWWQVFNQLAPGQAQVVEKIMRLRTELDQLDPTVLRRSVPRVNPANQFDMQSYPRPEWGRSSSPTGSSKPIQSTSAAPVKFSDQAASAGIQFQFRNGSLPDSLGDFMFEMSGGGVGVLDYNSDGWPDLYLTQGCDWPPRPDQTVYLDKLYRNSGNGRFEDVTVLARIFENGFSQGPAVGDFDQDGFPDLYVSNIGANRIFHNNGDGTFTEISGQPGTMDHRWTLSSVLADLNGDALPDIYNVNYLSGDDLFDRACGVKAGTSRIGCSPHEYPAAQDQLFVNLGDGRFEERTSEAGIVVPNGKGMGIIAADFDGSGKLSLFIGNDAVPNFFFVNETAHPGSEPRFQERASASGLAVDADGRAQACMGLAAGDANEDGLIDIFITNFRSESDTLYLNQSQMNFIDDTRGTGLREPTFEMLGFGTQFLDGELDGLPDLVLTNGHIGNLSSQGIAYEMRPQYFRNQGNARFTEGAPETLGPFFQGKWLGRGLARLDWNRDGKADFAVSHLTSPVALVTNQTPRTGHFVAIQLRGIQSERDAIGAQVSVSCGTRTWSHQLTAGDGYQASNQRQLVFGLGTADGVDKLVVRWPTGLVQEFGPLAVNREYLLIEGRHNPLSLKNE